MRKVRVSVVNFPVKNGDVEDNKKCMADYICEAATEKSEIVIFPEMALTGYDFTIGPDGQMMPLELAETVPGPSADFFAGLAKKYNQYIIFGMPEKDAENPEKVYNSAVIIDPSGKMMTHRKTHISPPESKWAAKGDRATVFESPWGPIGIAICYEVYRYPEFIRYAAAKGAGLFINCTAASEIPEPADAMRASLEGSSVVNHIFIASANLCGKDMTTEFFGGSNIVGPSHMKKAVDYYAGGPYGNENALIPGILSADIDLSEAGTDQFMYHTNPDYGTPDFWPGLFAGMYKELSEEEKYKR